MIRLSWNLLRLPLVVSLSVAASAQSAFVRVNQIGYVSGGAKRAYLMASAAETGATFVVKNSSGSTVFGPAAIGDKLGSWSSGFQDVYELDFDCFVTSGISSISMSGPIAPSYPKFVSVTTTCVE